MKYCFNAIYFTRFIFVNSVIVSSIISCKDLYQDFIIMYVWYFVSRNSISVLGAIWPSLSPCTVINPILLTYLANMVCICVPITRTKFENKYFSYYTAMLVEHISVLYYVPRTHYCAYCIVSLAHTHPLTTLILSCPLGHITVPTL